MWKTVIILGCCSISAVLANPVKLKNMAIMDDPEQQMNEKTELAMATLNLPSNATSIRADIVDSFTCANKSYGYYADVENECQIFHVCLPVTYPDGRENMFRWSFICPEETLFSQESFTCVRSEDMNFNCDESERFYELNRIFGLSSDASYERTSLEADRDDYYFQQNIRGVPLEEVSTNDEGDLKFVQPEEEIQNQNNDLVNVRKSENPEPKRPQVLKDNRRGGEESKKPELVQPKPQVETKPKFQITRKPVTTTIPTAKRTVNRNTYKNQRRPAAPQENVKNNNSNKKDDADSKVTTERITTVKYETSRLTTIKYERPRTTTIKPNLQKDKEDEKEKDEKKKDEKLEENVNKEESEVKEKINSDDKNGNEFIQETTEINIVKDEKETNKEPEKKEESMKEKIPDKLTEDKVKNPSELEGNQEDIIIKTITNLINSAQKDSLIGESSPSGGTVDLKKSDLPPLLYPIKNTPLDAFEINQLPKEPIKNEGAPAPENEIKEKVEDLSTLESSNYQETVEPEKSENADNEKSASPTILEEEKHETDEKLPTENVLLESNPQPSEQKVENTDQKPNSDSEFSEASLKETEVSSQNEDKLEDEAVNGNNDQLPEKSEKSEDEKEPSRPELNEPTELSPEDLPQQPAKPESLDEVKSEEAPAQQESQMPLEDSPKENSIPENPEEQSVDASTNENKEDLKTSSPAQEEELRPIYHRISSQPQVDLIKSEQNFANKNEFSKLQIASDELPNIELALNEGDIIVSPPSNEEESNKDEKPDLKENEFDKDPEKSKNDENTKEKEETISNDEKPATLEDPDKIENAEEDKEMRTDSNQDQSLRDYLIRIEESLPESISEKLDFADIKSLLPLENLEGDQQLEQQQLQQSSSEVQFIPVKDSFQEPILKDIFPEKILNENLPKIDEQLSPISRLFRRRMDPRKRRFLIKTT